MNTHESQIREPNDGFTEQTMTGTWPQRLARVEYVLLCALALVLPILEAPKNLFIFLLLLVWIAQRVVSRDITLSRPDVIGIALLFMLTSSLASTAANWPLINGLKGFQHTATQALVFWLIYRAAHSEQQRLRLAEMVVIGVMIGLVWGIVDFTQGREEYLTLHSVGGVIESATYIGIALVTAFSVAWTRPISMSSTGVIRSATLWWMAVAIILLGLFLTGNRGAILAVFVTYLVYALVIRRRSFWLAILGAMGLAAVLTTMLPDWFSQSRWLAKTQEMTANGRLTLSTSDRQRLDHWRVGVAQVAKGDALVLGIGPHNAVSIDYSKMEFNPPLGPLPEHLLHVHNMFLTKLIEEGIVGLVVMLFFFGTVITRLARDYRQGEWRQWRWFVAVGALAVSLVAGQVGPRWSQEHALLAVMILAIGLAPRTRDTV
jgi:O-antigen ligase